MLCSITDGANLRLRAIITPLHIAKSTNARENGIETDLKLIGWTIQLLETVWVHQKIDIDP